MEMKLTPRFYQNGERVFGPGVAELLKRVQEHHSLRAAAFSMEMAYSKAWQIIRTAEDGFGCKLLSSTIGGRHGGGAVLTPEGERLYSRVSVAYEQLRLAEDEIRRDCSLDTGVISIAVSETALHLLLLDKLSVFHASYPGVRLRIANDSTPQAIEALKRGQVDCAVVTTPAPQAAVLQQTPLLSFHGVLLCGNRYPELTREPMHLSELSVYSFIFASISSSVTALMVSTTSPSAK